MNRKLASNPIYKALARECEDLGLSYRAEIVGKGHPRLYVKHRGEERFVVFSLTPSDGRRGAMNAVQSLRSMLCVRRRTVKSRRRGVRRDRCKPVAKAPNVEPTPRRDPFAVLKEHPQYARGDSPC